MCRMSIEVILRSQPIARSYQGCGINTQSERAIENVQIV